MMKITVDLIKNYQEYLTEEEKSKSTIEKYIRDISAFEKWIGDMELNKIKVLDYKKKLVEKYTPAIMLIVFEKSIKIVKNYVRKYKVYVPYSHRKKLIAVIKSK